MTFDEFLLSNETQHKFERNYIIKIKFTDFIDFIYKPKYGDFEYHNDLEFLGLFDYLGKKLYGSSYYFEPNTSFSESTASKFYSGSIEYIMKNLKDSVGKMINNYIDSNQEMLMQLGQKTFDKYISIENNYDNIKSIATHNYIYSEELDDKEFTIDDYWYEKKAEKELTIEYLKNPLECTNKTYNEYMEGNQKIYSQSYRDESFDVSTKEYIGVYLLKKKLEKQILNEYENNPNNENKKKHDIIKSIKYLDAQMITITLKHNKNTISFKYPKSTLNNMSFSIWNIPDLKVRNEVDEIYKNIHDDNVFINDIAKIEYNRKVVYKDDKLLEINNELKKDEPDIVDDMFD